MVMDKQPTNCFSIDDEDNDELPPLTEAKRQAALAFENRYLLRAMKIAKGSVSEGARIAGLDRTNFRRLLNRHGISPVAFKQAAAEDAATVPTTIRFVRTMKSSVGAMS